MKQPMPSVKTIKKNFDFFKFHDLKNPTSSIWYLKILKGLGFFIIFQFFLVLFSFFHVLTYSKVIDSSPTLEKTLEQQNFNDVYKISQYLLKEGSIEDTKNIIHYLHDDLNSTQPNMNTEEQKKLYHLIEENKYHNLDKLYEVLRTEKKHCGPIGISSNIFASCFLWEQTNTDSLFASDQQKLDTKMKDIGYQLHEIK